MLILILIDIQYSEKAVFNFVVLYYVIVIYSKKTLWALFMDWVRGRVRGGSLLFTPKFPKTPGTYFIDLRRMKSLVDLRAIQ